METVLDDKILLAHGSGGKLGHELRPWPQSTTIIQQSDDMQNQRTPDDRQDAR